MKLRLFLSSIILAFLFITSPITFASVTNNGETLERNLFNAVINKNWSAFESMIAPEFQSINADQIRNREQLISYVKNIDFSKNDFTNFTVTQNPAGNILVVTYEMTYKETIAGDPQSGKKVKNLSVWEKRDGKWLWIAHAVID